MNKRYVLPITSEKERDYELKFLVLFRNAVIGKISIEFDTIFGSTAKAKALHSGKAFTTRSYIYSQSGLHSVLLPDLVYMIVCEFKLSTNCKFRFSSPSSYTFVVPSRRTTHIKPFRKE